MLCNVIFIQSTPKSELEENIWIQMQVLNPYLNQNKKPTPKHVQAQLMAQIYTSSENA